MGVHDAPAGPRDDRGVADVAGAGVDDSVEARLDDAALPETLDELGDPLGAFGHPAALAADDAAHLVDRAAGLEHHGIAEALGHTLRLAHVRADDRRRAVE